MQQLVMSDMPLFAKENDEMKIGQSSTENRKTATLSDCDKTTFRPRESEWHNVACSISEKEELLLILGALHADSGDGFRDALYHLITSEECNLIEESERSGNIKPALSIFDHLVKQDLPRRFAEIVGWRVPSGLAQVVEPAQNITGRKSFRVMTLKLSGSRGLKGRVAFRIVRDYTKLQGSFPHQAHLSLTDVVKNQYFTRIAYLEPLFHKGRILRSQASVKRHLCRRIDPLLVGFLGMGPASFGYCFSDPDVRAQLRSYYKENNIPFTVFLIAHWD